MGRLSTTECTYLPTLTVSFCVCPVCSDIGASAWVACAMCALLCWGG